MPSAGDAGSGVDGAGAGSAGDALRRVLGVDLGLKRSGLALSDPLGISLRALPNLIPRKRSDDVAALVALCVEHEVEAVVIGAAFMPQSGDESPMSKRARGFALALKHALAQSTMGTTRVFLVDERRTSVLARERLVASGVQKSKRKGALDGEAARIIAEGFLAGDRGEEVAADAAAQSTPSHSAALPLGE